MALSIATNNAALQAAASAASVNRDMETSMARLSSGKRINAASDDAAGVAMASRLSSEIRGTNQAIRNALDGQALIDTAEGAHKEVENILQRMREISIQAANDTNGSDDQASLQAEMTALVSEIDRIASVTTWAGQDMLNADGTAFSFQVGTATGTKNQIEVTLGSLASNKDGLNLNGAAITKATDTSAGSSQRHGTYTPSTGIFAIAYDTGSPDSGAIFDLTVANTPDVAGATYSFASTSKVASGGGNRATIGAEIVAAITASVDMKALGITAAYANNSVTLSFGITNNALVESKTTALRAVKNIDAAIKTVKLSVLSWAQSPTACLIQ